MRLAQGWALAILVPVMAALAPEAAAQFGHPLKGAWSGQWGTAGSETRLLVRMDWDGKAITGVINPGAAAAAIRSVTIDYSNPMAWKVTIEAERTDTAGKPVPIRAEGTLENLGAYYRVFHGTWTEGGRSGAFTLTRN